MTDHGTFTCYLCGGAFPRAGPPVTLEHFRAQEGEPEVAEVVEACDSCFCTYCGDIRASGHKTLCPMIPPNRN